MMPVGRAGLNDPNHESTSLFDAKSEENAKYFSKPEDLRSKSNSNIGRGLYQSTKNKVA